LRVVTSLDPDDKRTEEISVAGPAALLVAKAHKIGDRVTAREAGSKDRTQPKDAHDVFRLLQAVSPDAVPTGLELLLARGERDRDAHRGRAPPPAGRYARGGAVRSGWSR